MLKLSESFIGREILSLRTGGTIAVGQRAIINPDNLKIEGWHVVDQSEQQLILLSTEVRDIIENGMVVNDHEALTPAEDLIRLKPILELNFELIGKPVTTVGGKRWARSVIMPSIRPAYSSRKSTLPSQSSKTLRVAT